MPGASRETDKTLSAKITEIIHNEFKDVLRNMLI